MNTPVLLIVFNRTDTTARVLEVLKTVRPARLFVAADGPRAGRADDRENCAAVRALVQETVVWPCEIKTKYSEENLGCRRAVSSAISWFFDEVEAGIILEDDTLPDPSFFDYCGELLERYRDDERIGTIAGSNLLRKSYAEKNADYFFSAYPFIWGWATWRRVWRNYTADLLDYGTPESQWPALLEAVLDDPRAVDFWIGNFRSVAFEGNDTWDFQLYFYAFLKRYVSIVPRVNLISNLGFDQRATHTRSRNRFSALPVKPLATPLVHPASDEIKRSKPFDVKFNAVVNRPRLRSRVFRLLRPFVPEALVRKLRA